MPLRLVGAFVALPQNGGATTEVDQVSERLYITVARLIYRVSQYIEANSVSGIVYLLTPRCMQIQAKRIVLVSCVFLI